MASCKPLTPHHPKGIILLHDIPVEVGMRRSLTANQYVREHDHSLLLSTLQELALRFQGLSDQREIVGLALDWTARLGIGAAFLHPQLDSAILSVDATAGCDEQAQRALQSTTFAA